MVFEPINICIIFARDTPDYVTLMEALILGVPSARTHKGAIVAAPSGFQFPSKRPTSQEATSQGLLLHPLIEFPLNEGARLAHAPRDGTVTLLVCTFSVHSQCLGGVGIALSESVASLAEVRATSGRLCLVRFNFLSSCCCCIFFECESFVNNSHTAHIQRSR